MQKIELISETASEKFKIEAFYIKLRCKVCGNMWGVSTPINGQVDYRQCICEKCAGNEKLNEN